jgi:DNA-binding NtrC family response regulator
MSSILVIEDDPNKLSQLCTFITEAFGSIELITARSLRSGIRHVRERVFTLVLLDMTLPNFDATPDDSGGQAHNFGGREFLKQLDRFDINVPVIVVTQFITFGRGSNTIKLDDLDAELRSSFPGNYVGAVYYHASIQRWKEELQQLVKANLRAC